MRFEDAQFELEKLGSQLIKSVKKLWFFVLNSSLPRGGRCSLELPFPTLMYLTQATKMPIRAIV